MKYFEYTLLISLFSAVFVLPFYFYRRLKIYHFYRLVRKALAQKTAANCGETYFPTYYLKEIVSLLVKEKANRPLVYLCVGRSAPAIRWLDDRKKTFLSLVLQTICNKQTMLALWEKYIKKNPDNTAALAELGILFFMVGEIEKAQLCLNNIPEKKNRNYVSARQKYLQSYLDMNDGDMLGASQNASLAAKIFHKLGAEYEVGQSYLLLGIIYRVAIVSDVSQMMFETALQIFSTAKCLAETAAVYGNLGMLMAIQQRFEEAESYYQKADKIMAEINSPLGRAEILNQQSLLQLMQGNNRTAEDLAQKALEIHQQKQNQQGIAFSKEIMGNTAFNLQDYQKATQMAFEAKNLYKEHGNLSACLENMYLMSLALFYSEKSKESEKILREIIKMSKQCSSNFHVANAYNLLGLIYLKQNDLRRAKGLFQQSLDMEQTNNRLSGIATDYANIGLIEFRKGNIEQAQKTLKTALEYAEANQEEELISLLKNRLEEFLKN